MQAPPLFRHTASSEEEDEDEQATTITATMAHAIALMRRVISLVSARGQAARQRRARLGQPVVVQIDRGARASA